MMNPKKDELYTHYKRGGIYRIVGIGTLQSSNKASDENTVVIYEQIHDTPDYPTGHLWVRPLDMFLEKVSDEDGEMVLRFQKIK